MIRAFRPLDTLRLLSAGALKGENLACPRNGLIARRASLGYKLALVKEGLSPPSRGGTWIWCEGLRFKALASAKPLSGPRSWQILRLHIAEDDDATLLELVERLTTHAGYRGAERVVLRVPAGCPVEDVARRAGFFPQVRERLLEREGGRAISKPTELADLRPVQSHQEFAVFQLYCASTPASARSATGVTFDQWKDFMEPVRGKLAEVCYQQGGRISAWLRMSRIGDAIHPQLMVRPDATHLLPGLLDYAMSFKGKQLWLVPHYNETLDRMLMERGFKVVGEYSTLVKPIAVKIQRPPLAPVEA